MSYRIIKDPSAPGGYACLPAGETAWSCIICGAPIDGNPPWAVRTNDGTPIAIASCRECPPPTAEFFNTLVGGYAAAAIAASKAALRERSKPGRYASIQSEDI
jgi:hypothetical protein